MAIKHEITDGLNEEYYQITPDILGSFHKYRPPLDIFVLDESVARVSPYYRKGGRLTAEQVEELPDLANQGVVFVSRDDHPVYVKHISYQLDLVLVDKNLKETEIADIFVQALTRRTEELFEQPVPAVFDKFWRDLMVLTEYLSQDIHRSRALVRRLHREHSQPNHAVNCGFAGLALYGKLQVQDFEARRIVRKNFDRLAAGLFLHDIGMSKVPSFILSKEKPLTGDERTKINQHPNLGFQMLTKLDLKFPEVEACVAEHHERVNGTGYPQKKKGDAISFHGRLCGLVDSFCAMVTKRPYGEGKEFVAAASELRNNPGYDETMAGALQMLLMNDMKMKP